MAGMRDSCVFRFKPSLGIINLFDRLVVIRDFYSIILFSFLPLGFFILVLFYYFFVL